MSLSYYEEIKFSNSQDNFNITREQNKIDQIKGIPKLLETLNRNIQDIDTKLNSTRGKSQTSRMHTMQECSDLKNIVKQSVEGLSDIFNLKLTKNQLGANNNGSLKNVNNPLPFEVIKEEPLNEINRYDLNDNKSTKQDRSGNLNKKPKMNSNEGVLKNIAVMNSNKRDSGKNLNTRTKGITGDVSSNHESNYTNASTSNKNGGMSSNNYIETTPVNYSNKINKYKSTLDKNVVKKTNNINSGGGLRITKKNVNLNQYLNTDSDSSYISSIKDSNNKLTKNIQMIKEKLENKIPTHIMPQHISQPSLHIPPQNVPVPSNNNNNNNSNAIAKKGNINANTNDSTTPVQQSLNSYNIISSNTKDSNIDNALNKFQIRVNNKNIKRDKSSIGRYENIEEDKPLENIVLKPVTEKEFDSRSKSPLIKNYKLKPKQQMITENVSQNISTLNKTTAKKPTAPEPIPENIMASSNYMSEAKVSPNNKPKKISNSSANSINVSNAANASKRKNSVSRNSIRDEYSSKHSNENIPTNEFYVNTVENVQETVNKKIAKFLEENSGFNFHSFLQMTLILNELIRNKNLQIFEEKLLSSDLSILLVSLFNQHSDDSSPQRTFEEKRSKYDIKKVIKIQTNWRKYQVKKIFEKKQFNFTIKSMKNPKSKDQLKNYLVNKIDDNQKLKKLNSILMSCVDEFNKLLIADRNLCEIVEDYISISKENLSIKEKNRIYKNFISREINPDRKKRGDRGNSTKVKKESLNPGDKYTKKNVVNLNSTAVTNSELSGRSLINEKCPEVETLKHSILISNNQSQIKSITREDNSTIKSPKMDSLKRKNFSLNQTSHDTEMDLRMMKHELEKDLDL